MRSFSKNRPKPEPPTLEQVTTLFLKEGSTTIEGKIFYYHYSATGWHLGYTPVHNWRALALEWLAREVKKTQEDSTAPKPPANFFRVYTAQEEEELRLVREGYARLRGGAGGLE